MKNRIAVTSVLRAAVLLGVMTIGLSQRTLGQSPCYQGQECNPSRLNKVVYVDGSTYTFDATGINNAISAVTSTGGTVVLPPTGSLSGGVIAMGGTYISVPSNVCVRGAGMYSTILRWTSPVTGGFFLGDGVNNACVRDLGLSFGSATTGSAGIRMGTTTTSQAVQYNTIKDVSITFDSIFTTGTAGIFATGYTAEVSLNTFDTIIIQNAVEAVECDKCEGNFWKNIQGANLGGTGNGAVFFVETGSSDEFIDARLESGSSNGLNDTCFSTNGPNHVVRLVCDMANTGTAVNDTGTYSMFDVTTIGCPPNQAGCQQPDGGKVTLGTVAPTSQYRYSAVFPQVALQKPSITSFSNLPPCGSSSTTGAMANISDSTTNAWGATISGGGGLFVTALCDGATWKVIGR